MNYVDYPIGFTTVTIPFKTSDASGAAVAPSSAYAAADVLVYKNGGNVQRSSTAGFTVTSPFDSDVGSHMVVIDTTNNTDAGFWSEGAIYDVLLKSAKTVDGVATLQWIGKFSIDIVGVTAALDGVADGLLTEEQIANAVWDKTLDSVDPTGNTMGSALYALRPLVVRSAMLGDDAGASTAILDGGASSEDDAYNRYMLIADGEARLIEDYDGASQTAIVDAPWTNPPGADTPYVIVALSYGIARQETLEAVPAAIRTELGTELGRIDAAVSSRLPTSGYTAPTNLSAAQVRTELAVELARMDAAVSSRMATFAYTAPPSAAAIRAEMDANSADLDAIGVLATAISAKTVNLPAAPAAVGDVPTANQNADALLDRANGVEVGVAPRGAFRLMLSMLAGKVSGARTGTETFRSAVADSKDRVVVTADEDGNRTAVVTDQT